MESLAPAQPAQSLRIALLIMGAEDTAAPCPFFGKCDGFLLFAPASRTAEFHRSEVHTADALYDMIVSSGANAVICGFIRDSEKQKFLAAGIDVRLGSCACPVSELAANFDDLPLA